MLDINEIPQKSKEHGAAQGVEQVDGEPIADGSDLPTPPAGLIVKPKAGLYSEPPDEEQVEQEIEKEERW